MHSQSRKTLLQILLFIALSFTPSLLSGQGFGGGGNNRIDGKYKFMPIPYLNYDRSSGFAVGAVPMLMFNPSKKDTISPSSLIGVVGTYSTNKTWFLMGFGKFILDEDNWRITTGGALELSIFSFTWTIPWVSGSLTRVKRISSC